MPKRDQSPRPVAGLRDASPTARRTWLLVILLLGFLVRMLPWMRQNGEIIFLSPDSYYHLWRVAGFLKQFPSLIVFDPYLNFPSGGYCIWPFLFDYLVALALKLFGIPAFSHAFEAACFIYPALYGTAVIAVVYLLGKEILSAKTGLIAAGFYSVLPTALEWGRAGYFDHDIAYVLFSALAFYFFLRSLTRAGCVVASGVFLSLSFFVWQGSLLFASILWLAALGIWVFKGTKRALALGAGALGIAAVAVFPYALLTSLKTASFLSPDYLSLFYPLVLAFAAGALVVLYGWAKRKYEIAVLSSLVWLVAAVIAFLAQGRRLVPFVLAFLFKRDPWLRSIQEFQPIIAFHPGVSILPSEVYFGWGFLALPLIGMWFARKRKPTPSGLFFAIWSLATLGLVLLQLRYAVAFALPFCLWLAYATIVIAQLRRKWRFVALLAWLVLVLNQFLFYPYLPAHPSVSRKMQEWMRDHLFSDPPEYAILSEWDVGHELRYDVRIPPLADNFGTQSSHLREAADYFTSRDEGAVQGLFTKNRIRWVLAFQGAPNMEIYQALSPGREFVALKERQWKKALFQGIKKADQFQISPEYFGLLNSRLYFFDGLELGPEGPGGEGLQCFRLIYESEETGEAFGRSFPSKKLFEVVQGAKIKFRGVPGTALRIGLQVATNTGRRFVYGRRVSLSSSGEGKLILPYSTQENPYPVKAVGRYLVECAGKAWGFDVTEDKVLSGGIVSLDLPAK